MRNLKRALSLALASVMLMGMMVVGTSAASFTDVESTDNVEAIEVMNALEIMVGDGNGFNPDQKVTRNEMAVVIAKLLGMKSEDFVGSTQFTDVPAWADGFVGACYAEGIIKGYNDTTFGGADGVKAVDAGLMVMKALGYFQFESDFEDDYVLAAAKQASKIELFKGIDAGVNETLTRNEVAQLVLNALESVVVEGEQVGSNVNISAGDVSVSVSGTTKYTDETNNIKYNGVDNNKEYLVEKLYGAKVTKDTETAFDAYGRPATKWAYAKNATTTKTVTVADEAYAVYVGTFNSEIVDDLKDADIVLPETATYNKADVIDVADLYDGKTAVNGYTVELYNTDDNAKTIEKIVVIESNFATVTDVELTEGKTAGSVELTVSAYPADVVLTFTDDLKKSSDNYDKLCGYAEDTALIVTMNWETKAPIAIEEPTAVSGKITKINAGKYNCTTTATIDGTTYGMNNLFVDAKTLKVGDEGTLYLDAQGNAIGWSEKAAAKAQYAYVLATDSEAGGLFESDFTYYAKLLYVDGTVEVVEITEDETDKTGIVSYAKITSGSDKGKIDLTAVGGNTANKTITKGEVLNTKLSGKNVLNNKTVFVVETIKDSVSTYTVYTGVANVPTLTAANVGFMTDKGAITLVFAMDSKLSVDADANKNVTYLAGVSSAITEIIDDETVTYYIYNAIVDGEITTVTATANGLGGVMYKELSLDENGMIDGKTAEKQSGTKIEYVQDAKVDAAAKDGVIKIGGTNYLYDDATVVYKVADGEITKTTIAKVAKDAVVDFYTTEDVVTMIVIEG